MLRGVTWEPGLGGRSACCGHDLLAVLSLALHKVLGTHSSGELRPEMLQKSLRLAYEYRYFMKTQLYQRLRLWEQHHPGFTLFPPADE
ncbi:hypothetical protein KTAU_11990 [Thermogemmatispora aurantia]|uniref:Uncharacterized protein n=1 Tax=Thermogemmatispora aurantia TaxID=2045279 RepID=A0A5J4K665_9CHLR|nr:hypothetical protein KTAU_11990 [Thermogemmatispora aurantia]